MPLDFGASFETCKDQVFQKGLRVIRRCFPPVEVAARGFEFGDGDGRCKLPDCRSDCGVPIYWLCLSTGVLGFSISSTAEFLILVQCL